MGFNYKKEFEKFKTAFEADKAIMLAEGMSEEVINELYAHDLAEFNSNRKFYRRQDEHADIYDEEWLHKETKHIEKPDVESEIFKKLSITEAICAELHSAMSCLSDGEKEVLALCYEKDMRLKDAAVLLGLSYETAKRRHSRAIQKIKKYF